MNISSTTGSASWLNKQQSAEQIYSLLGDISMRNLSNKEAISLIDSSIKAYRAIFGPAPKTEEKQIMKEISSYEKNESVETKEVKKIY